MLKITVHTKGLEAIKDKLAQGCTKAEHTVALQIREDTRPYVPARNFVLDTTTRVDGNLIIYQQPYAHYLYQGVVWVDPVTKAAGFLTEDGWKSRKGVKKIESNRKLKISRSKHPEAQSHWFEASKAEKLEKWVRVADKAVKNDL